MGIADFAASYGAAIVAVIGVVVSIVLAARQLRRQRKLTAQRATLDLISRFEIHNQRWVELRSEFVDLRSKNTLGLLVNPTEEEQKENDPEKKARLRAERERKRILVVTYLNHFECVAVGIHHGIVDEDIYKEWHEGAYIRAWNDANSFAVDMRHMRQNSNLFKHFEELAKKWDKDRRHRESQS